MEEDCLSAPHGGRDIQGGIVEPMTIVSYKHKKMKTVKLITCDDAFQAHVIQVP